MKLLTSLVAVKKVKSVIPRSNFSANDIEQTAQSILDAEGIINPMVVKRTGVESYEVVSGHFEYYAAVRAREIDPRKGEMISAYIIEEDKELAITKQLKILRNDQRHNNSLEDASSEQPIEFTTQLNNFESYVNQKLQDFKELQAKNQQFIEKQLKELAQNIPQKIKPIDVFNESDITDLVQKLKLGFNPKQANFVAQEIIKERKKKEFSSLSDVIERVKLKQKTRTIRAITEKKMIELIHNWSTVLFI
jgi:predicted nucleic acid-binding OB-fold protein